jgi:hypothetical protein
MQDELVDGDIDLQRLRELLCRCAGPWVPGPYGLGRYNDSMDGRN